MKVIIPNNIFATLLVLSLEDESRPEIEVKEAATIAGELSNDLGSVGILPSFDLIKNKELFVSANIGICFDGPLSNSYMYFGKNGSLDKLKLRGDISTNEAILSKIVMQERYEISPEVILDSDEKFDEANNLLIAGNNNWIKSLHTRGISFSEQVSELIDHPYQNFLFASTDENSIKELNILFEKSNQKIITNLEKLLLRINLTEDVNNLIREEINSVYFDQTNYENDGLTELLKLSYYHQIIDNMFEVKFV